MKVERVLQHISTPIYFNSLVVESTTLCNAKCAMCYQSSGPKGSDSLGIASLTVEEIKKILSDAINIPALRKRFHLAGGEAFIYFNDCLELFSYAKNIGFPTITATSNGFWAKNIKRGREFAWEARKAGLGGIEISWDAWHEEHIAAEAVNNCIIACKEVGISVNLRLLASKSHRHGESLSKLSPTAIECADRITCCPVFPVGRALSAFDDSDFFKRTCDSMCFPILNLVVNSFGDVFPCCAGLDQAEGFGFGNIRRQSITDIEKSMEHSQLLRIIAFLGVSYFLDVLADAGIDMGKPENYGNICHLCWSIFSNAEARTAIFKYLDGLNTPALAMAIDFLDVKINSAKERENYAV